MNIIGLNPHYISSLTHGARPKFDYFKFLILLVQRDDDHEVIKEMRDRLPAISTAPILLPIRAPNSFSFLVPTQTD